MYENGKLVELNINDVLPNRFQPRIYFNEEKLTQLAESIHKYGVIQPIVVRPVNNKYEIIAGERRYKASKLAARSTIPAIIVNLTDRESEEIALLENVQRQELTPIEEAVSYKRILDMGYITQESLAKKIGKAQSTIANKVRLLNLDDKVQEALLNGKISERHARSLLKISSRKIQREMLDRIINERLTVKRTDEEISKLNLNESNINFKKNNTNIEKEPIENLFEVKEDRKDGFMDIDKIMREAKDINTETSQNNIDQLMQQPGQNQGVAPVAPTFTQPDSQPVQTPADDNKFIHIRPNEQPVEPVRQVQQDTNYNNIFNPTISDLKQPMPSETPQVVTSSPVPPVVNTPAEPSMVNTPTPSQEPMVSTPPVVSPEPLVVNNPVPESPIVNNPTQSVVYDKSSIASAVSAAFDAVKPNKEEIPTSESLTIAPATIQQPNSSSQEPVTINPVPAAPTATTSSPLINELNITQSATQPEAPANIYRQEASSINSNIPKADILEDMPTANVQPSSMVVPAKPVNIPNNNFSEVIRLIRECSNKIEALGYTLNVDEADLENSYQVIFNIDKD